MPKQSPSWNVYPAGLLYGAPEVRLDSFTWPGQLAPPSEVAVYQVLNALVRLSCQARRKSPGAGPLAICGKLLSPRELSNCGALHVTPSAEVAVYRLFGPPATALNV